VRDNHLDPVDGFEPQVGRFVAMLQDTRSRLLRDLEDLTDGELDRVLPWAPNSVGTLLYHVAAIELDWTFADILESDDFPDGAEDWFPVDVREDDGRLSPVVEPLEQHMERLDWVRQHLLVTLKGLSDVDLDRTVNPENPSSVGWILQHLMQHEAEHRGQIGEVRAAIRHS